MIRIDKGSAPEELVEKEAALIASYITDFDNNKEDYLSGKKTFSITDDYKMPAVKAKLLTRQKKKCCFSETKFIGDYPHVEHFRPKKRVDLITPRKSLYPGYYWLAYNWENLFLCKQLINCSFKKNCFPLVDESNRNRSHHDTNIEDNLIIDPSKENPRDHIRFVEYELKPITQKGKFNIDFLGLRHPDFTEARRIRFYELKKLKEEVDVGFGQGINVKEDPMLAGNIAILKASIEPDAQFSSMAIDLLQDWPPLL